jgi:esterase/lipase
VNARLFTIVEKGDTIHFLKTDTCLTAKKPTIIFCQGSLPIPLVIDLGGNGMFIPSLNNFGYQTLLKKYNFIVISMPHTPPIVPAYMLNNRHQYVPDTVKQNAFDKLYLQDNFLDKYVERANYVLKYLKKQKWVDTKNISVFGHSQGSFIALKLAQENPSIRAIGYAAGNPSGRFSLFIRQQRRAVINEDITANEGQKNIEESYKRWKSYCKGINPEGDNADRAKTWISFSEPLWTNLIQLKTPIFITYGTEDLESAESCELLPLYFEMHKKTNYKMYPLVGCGHNFEETSSEGVSDYSKMHWVDVMNSFVEWVEKLQKR